MMSKTSGAPSNDITTNTYSCRSSVIPSFWNCSCVSGQNSVGSECYVRLSFSAIRNQAERLWCRKTMSVVTFVIDVPANPNEYFLID